MNVDSVTRNAEGCWTCRVRRKKCDKHGPVSCHVCSALLITCHYTREKPDWMDGGERQQEMTEQLKQEVRNKAPYRRSLAYAKALDAFMPDAASPVLPESSPKALDMGSSPVIPYRTSSETLSIAEKLMPSSSSLPHLPDISSLAPSISPHDHPSPYNDLQRAPDWAGLDRGLIVCYLDFFFPFLFPFYQPSILNRGRAWLIDFITDSQAMEQTTLSLSSYLFSLTIEMSKESGHERCREIAWEKLLHQIHSTFGLLQEELCCFMTEAVSKRLSKTVQIMGCVLLLQRFETAIRSFENCQTHLSAAVELFKQALEGADVAASDQAPSTSKFESITQQLRDHGSPWPRRIQTFRAPSSEYMAFRFFSALLLVDDIVASTALGQEPRLLQYHDEILGNGQWAAAEDADDQKAPICLESVMGCQNWAMIAVTQISALDAWKKRQRAAGDLDVMELARRATAIKSTLAAHLARAETAPSRVSSSAAPNNNPWDIFTPCNDVQGPALAGQSLLVTRIWAHAAAVYLSVVVSGWQPAGSEIRYHVARVIELLSLRLLSWAVLRTVAWPFCVAGCLAAPAQEPLLRGVVEGLRPPGLLGPLQKAMEVIENVWRRRESLDSTYWDLEACFRVLDHMVLLV